MSFFIFPKSVQVSLPQSQSGSFPSLEVSQFVGMYLFVKLSDCLVSLLDCKNYEYKNSGFTHWHEQLEQCLVHRRYSVNLFDLFIFKERGREGERGGETWL